ncbi:MAG TPA: hypothetical protein V6D03_00930, partial [Candidatus Caenarcaniphilales bacterium]
EKDSSDLLQDQVIKLPTADVGIKLAAWFARGERPTWKFSHFHREVLVKAKLAQRWERSDTGALLALYHLNRLEDIPNERVYQQIRHALSLMPVEGLERAEKLLSLTSHRVAASTDANLAATLPGTHTPTDKTAAPG